VQAGPQRTTQVGVQGLADEVVHETVGQYRTGSDLDQSRGFRFVERLQERNTADVFDSPEGERVEFASHHRRDAQLAQGACDVLEEQQ
jgi:hypothetical protein